MSAAKTLATVAVLAATLAGCGEKPNDGGKIDLVDNGLPSCSEVWVAGQTLPGKYEGCANDDVIEAVVTGSDGFVYYNDTLRAKLGGKIEEVN
jgi:hypothetical protein